MALGRYVLTADVVIPAGVASYSAAGPATTTTGSTTASPTAGLTATSQAVASGTFLLSWTATLQTAAAAGDVNNFGLYNGAVLVATSVNLGVVASYPQAAVTTYTGTSPTTMAVKNIGAGSTGSVYNASLTVTPLTGGDNKGAFAWTGPGSPPGWSPGPFPVTFLVGTPMWLDSAGDLYATLAASLRAWVDGQDDVGHAALSNLQEDAMIQQPPVLATSPAGTTNTTTNATGQTVNVSVSSNGSTMANYWLNAVSQATSAAQFMMTVPAGGTVALQYTVAVPIWYWSVLTPALPATTVAAVNTSGKNLSVVAWGGTTTFWYVNSVQVATTTPAASAAPLALALPPGATISCTYSVAPVWAWLDYLDMGVLANSNGSVYAGENSIAPTGVTGYSPLSALAYPVHSGMSALGFGAGVAN